MIKQKLEQTINNTASNGSQYSTQGIIYSSDESNNECCVYYENNNGNIIKKSNVSVTIGDWFPSSGDKVLLTVSGDACFITGPYNTNYSEERAKRKLSNDVTTDSTGQTGGFVF